MKKTWKKWAVIVGCILLAVGLVISGASFAAMGFSLKSFSSPRAPVADPETYSFTGDEIAAVEIKSGSCQIRVEGVPGLKAPELTVSPDVFEYELKAGTGGLKLIVRETDNARNGGWRWYQLFTYTSSDHSETVLRLPEDYSGSLRLESSLGGVRTQGLTNLGGLQVESDNETVQLSDLTVKGGAEVTSSFGSITVKNCAAESFSVQDANGNVSLEGCRAKDAALSTEFGNLRVNEGGFGTLTLENSNGDSELGGVEAEESLRYHSNFGRLSFDGLKCPDLELRSENGSIRGTLEGSEREYKISAAVKNGSTNLRGRLEGRNTLVVESEFGNVDISFTED